MHQNFQTGRRPVARASTRGGGDAPDVLWALCPDRSRSWSRRAAPGSPYLQTTRSPTVPSYTQRTHTHRANRSLSRHCALSPSEYPPTPGRSDAAAASKETVFSLLGLYKVFRSSKCGFSFLQVKKKQIIWKTFGVSSISSKRCVSFFSKLFHNGAALQYRYILSSIGKKARLLSKNCTNSSLGHRPRLSRNAWNPRHQVQITPAGN